MNAVPCEQPQEVRLPEKPCLIRVTEWGAAFESLLQNCFELAFLWESLSDARFPREIRKFSSAPTRVILQLVDVRANPLGQVIDPPNKLEQDGTGLLSNKHKKGNMGRKQCPF